MKNLSEKYGNFFTLVCKVGGRFCNRKKFVIFIIKKTSCSNKIGPIFTDNGPYTLYIYWL